MPALPRAYTVATDKHADCPADGAVVTVESTLPSPAPGKDHSEVGKADHAVNDRPALPEVPDGGLRAWIVVTGSFLSLFAGFGMVNSYGVFQGYYKAVLLPQAPSALVSLNGSLQLFCLFGAAPLIGKIFDAYGPTILMPLGSFCIVFGHMVLSLVHPGKIWQVFLCQAVLVGIGNALIFMPSLAILSHWFRRRRSYALGIVTSGSAVGGIVFPIVLQRLINQVGFPWAVRMCGFTSLVCLCIACAAIRTNLPLNPPTDKGYFVRLIDVGGFKDSRYIFATLGAFCIFYGIFIPFFYLKQYATFQRVDPTLADYLLSILNACGIASRVVPGLVADRIGPLATLVPCLLLSAVFVLALWLPSASAGALVAFSVVYGLFSGAVFSLLPAFVNLISPREVYGARLGAVYAVIAVSVLCGSPTAGSFLGPGDRETQRGQYRRLIAFAGAMLLAGTLFFGVALVIDMRRKSLTRRGKVKPAGAAAVGFATSS
ncbi:unnamed protein product [Parajaminaea phylloscopi]